MSTRQRYRDGTTPPDPATFDASDESRFVAYPAAMRVTGKGLRFLESIAADHPEATFYVGGTLYFHREPLMRLILR